MLNKRGFDRYFGLHLEASIFINSRKFLQRARMYSRKHNSYRRPSAAFSAVSNFISDRTSAACRPLHHTCRLSSLTKNKATYTDLSLPNPNFGISDKKEKSRDSIPRALQSTRGCSRFSTFEFELSSPTVIIPSSAAAAARTGALARRDSTVMHTGSRN